jgi:hypothetical protein
VWLSVDASPARTLGAIQLQLGCSPGPSKVGLGTLRSQRNIPRQDGFALVVSASQGVNVQLCEVARQITDSAAKAMVPA